MNIMKKCWCGNDKLYDYSEDYFRCDKCQTLISKMELETSIYKVEDEEKGLYGKNYWEVSMMEETGKNSISEIIDMYLTERVPYWLQNILKYVKLGSDVAEIGCGLGQLQYVLKRLGYNQMAYELSLDICSYVKNNLGININCGTIEGHSEKYDAILAFDLFEHLIEPLQFIEQCGNNLKTEGVLCIQTPCYDHQLSYDEMLRLKGRFVQLLKTEQHVYLYSKDSITDLLRRFGFEHIVFEPAFFGDDYDMFLFASQNEITINTPEEIDAFLNSTENGRLVKAILYLSDEKKKLFSEYEIADNDRIERLAQIEKLSALLEESEADRAARLEQINTLTNILNNKKKRWKLGENIK